MTVADFFHDSTKGIRDQFDLKADPSSTCSLMFGVWDPHFKDEWDKKAMLKLVQKSLWVGAEASLHAKKFVELIGKICEKKGMNLESDFKVDCRGTSGNENKTDVSVTRFLKLYERDGKGKSKSKGKGDSLSDSSESE